MQGDIGKVLDNHGTSLPQQGLTCLKQKALRLLQTKARYFYNICKHGGNLKLATVLIVDNAFSTLGSDQAQNVWTNLMEAIISVILAWSNRKFTMPPVSQ